MVNLVIVSHSRKLAEGVCEVARQMASREMRIEAVGGIADLSEPGAPQVALGTDALAIAQAITAALSVEGVLILVDMGSACFAAEEAVEMLPDQLRPLAHISNAPLVEGAIVAAVEASLGKSLAQVNAAAEEAGRMPKR